MCRCDGICVGHDLNRCSGWWLQLVISLGVVVVLLLNAMEVLMVGGGSGPYLKPIIHIQHTHSQHLVHAHKPLQTIMG